jgi:hypothetical protein
VNLLTDVHDKRFLFEEDKFARSRPVVGLLVVGQSRFCNDTDYAGEADVTVGGLVGGGGRHGWGGEIDWLDWSVGLGRSREEENSKWWMDLNNVP